MSALGMTGTGTQSLIMKQSETSINENFRHLLGGTKLGIGRFFKVSGFLIKCCEYCTLCSLVTMPLLGEETGAESPTEAFKVYLQECPTIKTVIFQRRVLSVPNIPGETVPISITNNFKMYQGAWHQNAFFVRELRDLKDLNTVIDTNTFTADLLINGRSSERWWDVINTQITSWTETRDEKTSPVRRKVELAESILDPILHLGINNLKPRTLRWDGKHFTAQTTAGKVIEGNLATLENVPESIEVNYRDSKVISYVCEYQYDKSTPSPNTLPSTILRYRIVNGVKTPSWVANILTFDTAQEELPPGYFDPERFVDKRNAITYIQSNRNEFKLLNNSLLKLPGNDLLSDKPVLRSKTARFVVLSSMMISVLVAIALFVRRKTKKQMRYK